MMEVSEEKPDVFKEGNNWYYRASSLGGCKRALVAQRKGYEVTPTPDWIKGTYQAGKDAEPTAIDLLRVDGWRISNQQLEVRIAITDTVFVIGHIDLMGEYGEYESSIIEVKSQSALEYAKGINWGAGLWPKYRWQASCYGIGLRIPVLIMRFNRATGEWVLESFDCSYSFDQIAERVMSIHESVTLPVTCSTKNSPCNVYYLCENTGEVVDADSERAVIDLARQYRSAKQSVETASEEVKRLRGLLHGVVGTGKSTCSDGTIVNFYGQRNPKQVDWDAIKRAYPDFDKGRFMKDGEMNERLRVNLPED